MSQNREIFDRVRRKFKIKSKQSPVGILIVLLNDQSVERRLVGVLGCSMFGVADFPKPAY